MKSKNLRYNDGDRVQIKASGRTGPYSDIYSGVVIGWYDIDPPAYEVRFGNEGGEQFDALILEEEIEPVQSDDMTD